jgi:hypothetical protein
MAIMKTFKGKESLPKPDKNPENPVDHHIMEYLYAATIEDILGDDDLVKLINKNGFYRTCFCEAFDLYEIVITIENKEFIWTRPDNLKISNLDIFKHLNERGNINDIEKYRILRQQNLDSTRDSELESLKE